MSAGGKTALGTAVTGIMIDPRTRGPISVGSIEMGLEAVSDRVISPVAIIRGAVRGSWTIGP